MPLIRARGFLLRQLQYAGADDPECTVNIFLLAPAIFLIGTVSL